MSRKECVRGVERPVSFSLPRGFKEEKKGRLIVFALRQALGAGVHLRIFGATARTLLHPANVVVCMLAEAAQAAGRLLYTFPSRSRAFSNGTSVRASRGPSSARRFVFFVCSTGCCAGGRVDERLCASRLMCCEPLCELYGLTWLENAFPCSESGGCLAGTKLPVSCRRR